MFSVISFLFSLSLF